MTRREDVIFAANGKGEMERLSLLRRLIVCFCILTRVYIYTLLLDLFELHVLTQVEHFYDFATSWSFCHWGGPK